MVLSDTQNFHTFILGLVVFKYLNFIAFGTWTLSANKAHRALLKWFQSKIVPIKTKQKFVQERYGAFIVCEMFLYGLIPLALISEKLATLHEHSNG